MHLLWQHGFWVEDMDTPNTQPGPQSFQGLHQSTLTASINPPINFPDFYPIQTESLWDVLRHVLFSPHEHIPASPICTYSVGSAPKLCNRVKISHLIGPLFQKTYLSITWLADTNVAIATSACLRLRRATLIWDCGGLDQHETKQASSGGVWLRVTWPPSAPHARHVHVLRVVSRFTWPKLSWQQAEESDEIIQADDESICLVCEITWPGYFHTWLIKEQWITWPGWPYQYLPPLIRSLSTLHSSNGAVLIWDFLSFQLRLFGGGEVGIYRLIEGLKKYEKMLIIILQVLR